MNLKQNQEFIEKVKKSGSLAKKMSQISERFRELEQLALYSELDPAANRMLLAIPGADNAKWDPKCTQRITLQLVLGGRQPTGAKSIEKLLLNLINLMPRPTESYSVVYVNTLASTNAYADFKKLMEFLPIEYFQHLDKVYVLHGNFKNKASSWMSFDNLTNFLKAKTLYCDAFQELAIKIGLNREALLSLLPPEIVQELARREPAVKQIQELQAAKANIIYNPNIYNIHEQEYIEKKPILKSILKADPSQQPIEQYEAGQTGAPLIIELLISYFHGKEELLDAEGLFRKSVSIDEETNLLKSLYRENYDCLEAVTDPHLVANAIKRFLSNLPEPLIPFQQHKELMAVGQENLNSCVLKILTSLPTCRKMTFLLLGDFLKEKLLPRAELNKMSEKNLSIVFGPCFMRSEVPSMMDLVFTQKSINATAAIFLEFEKIFGNAKERTILIRKSVQVQGRQTLKERLGDVELEIDKLAFQEQQIAKKQAELKEDGSRNKILNGISEMMKQEMIEQQKLESLVILEGESEEK